MSQPSQFIQGMMNMQGLGPYANMQNMAQSGNPNQMDPSNNNMPLSFNTGKNKPPMPRPSGEFDDPNSQVINETPSSTSGDGLLQPGNMMSHGGTMMSQGGNMMQAGGEMYNMTNMGYGGPMQYSTPDPSMMMMGPMVNQGNMFGMNSMIGPMNPLPNYGEREVITLKSCSLYPPPPGAPPRSLRDRPPGCRTAFIGGLPETCTEDILNEVFEKCGTIVSIRLSKKNFAHIRYEFHDSVEKSIFISGYRMKIDNKDDKPNTGRIHVDYAMARDDQYEYECQERAMAREMRHQQRMEEERMRPPSPPPAIVFSEHEASSLTERLKTDGDFMMASEQLVLWMEKGDCNRRTNASFYSMIQCVNSHVRRLLNEKQMSQDEIMRVKMQAQYKYQEILKQFDQIVRVFNTATKQRAWDHFTKAQRKNLDIWAKQAEETRNIQQEEFLSERQEDEMEMSDEEGDGPVKKRKVDNLGGAEMNRLKDENDTLKCQMEAFKNEVDFVKQESINSVDEKDKQIKALQNALQGMQQQLIGAQQQMKKSEQLHKERERQLELEKAKIVQSNDKKLSESSTEATPPADDAAEKVVVVEEQSETKSQSTEGSSPDMVEVPTLPVLATIPARQVDSVVSSSGINLTSKEAKIIGLISCFLHVHPSGATVDYLWSYLNQMISCRPREIEDVLERLPMLYRQELQGVGARLERRWVFTAYTSGSDTPSTSGF